jgi:hypothetical protein
MLALMGLLSHASKPDLSSTRLSLVGPVLSSVHGKITNDVSLTEFRMYASLTEVFHAIAKDGVVTQSALHHRLVHAYGIDVWTDARLVHTAQLLKLTPEVAIRSIYTIVIRNRA